MKGRLLLPLCCLIHAYFANAASPETELNPCYAYELPCDDLQCIGREGWCDGKADCTDRSDEKYCNTRKWYNVLSPNDCSPEKHFECRNGQCVPAAARCDGSDDCEDGSDDDGCDESTSEEPSDEDDNVSERPPITSISDFSAGIFDDDSLEDSSTTTESPFEITSTSVHVTTKASSIRESSTSEENDYETPRTYRIPQVATSTVSHPETPRTSRIYKIPEPTIDYRDIPGRRRLPWSSKTERDYYDRKMEEVTENVVFNYNTVRQHTPSYERGNNENGRQTSYYNRPLPHSNGGSDTTPSILLPDSEHGTLSRRQTHTNGRVSPRTERTDIRQSFTTPTPLITYSDSFRGHHQLRNGYGSSYIVQLRRKRFPSQGQHPVVARGHAQQHQVHQPDEQATFTSGPRRAESSREEPRREDSRRAEPRCEEQRCTETRRDEPRRDELRRSESSREEPRREDSRRAEPRCEEQRCTETRRDVPRRDEPRRDEPRLDEPRCEEARCEEPRREEPKRAEPRCEESRCAKPRHEEPRRDEPRCEEPRCVEPRREETRRAERRRDEPSRAEPRCEEARCAEQRREEPRREEPRREEPRRAEPKRALPPFYFQKNYAQSFRNKYAKEVRNAKRWLLEQRDDSYEWGGDTPRALIALSLITNGFLNNDTENELMQKRLATHLGIKLLELRDEPTKMSDIRLATYINALLATCQDPRDFLDQDLTRMLLERNNRPSVRPSINSINPMIYLTLCLTNASTQRHDLHWLNYLLELRDEGESVRDRQILATTALACFQQQDEYKYELKPRVEAAFHKLLGKRRSDGSFGSIYTTALAAQALMSINTSMSWNPELTLDYLAERQSEDGSFGDMLATYYILPALSGRSLLHLRNTRCDQTHTRNLTIEDILNQPGPKTNIFMTLKIGNPETSSVTTFVRMPSGTNFFDAMKIAEFLNPNFRFHFNKQSNGEVDIHSVSDVPNDVELAYRWHLYVVPGLGPADINVDLRQPVYYQDLRELIPKEADEIIFWYLRI